MKTLIFLGFLVAFSSAFAKGELECRLIDERWMVFNTLSNSYIGTGGADESNPSRCQDYLASQKDDVVCIFADKDDYRVYHVDSGKQVGAGSSKTLEDCTEGLSRTQNGLTCSFDSEETGYRVTRISDGKSLGRIGSTLASRCSDYLGASNKDMVCLYEGKDQFHAFKIADGKIMGGGHYAETLERCKEYLDTQKNGLFCHYDGTSGKNSRYLVYKLRDNKPYGFPFGTYAKTFEACQEQIKHFEFDKSGEPKNTEVESDEVAEILVDQWQPFIKSLTRNVFFYSYYDRGELGLSANEKIPLRSLQIAKGLAGWKESFEQLAPFEEGWLGYGLYGAVNPVDSSAYATGEWILSEIEVPAGESFLDMRLNDLREPYNYGLHLDQGGRKELMDRCRLPAVSFTEAKFKLSGRKYSWSINKVDLIKNRICFEGLQKALKILKVGFLVYNWYYVHENSIRKYTGGCDNNEAPAVLFVNTQLTSTNVKAFNKNGNDMFPDEYRRIYQLAALRVDAPSASWPQYKDPSAVKITGRELDHQFGCKNSFVEDRVLGIEGI